MKSLTYRSFPMHFSSSSRCLSLLFLHSAAGDAGALAPRRESRRFSLWLRSSAHSFSSSSSTKHFEEDGRNVKVAVWWDFENCNIPVGVNVFRVAHRITAALRSNGIKGPVTITAFGDMSQLSRASQEALISTGVCLNHVPCGGKNSSDRFFMADLLYWVQQNPPPAHFFLISGDRDFANVIHRLRMSNYNILLASKDAAPGVLRSAATIMWSWSCLVKGENTAVKHFNHPPDGLYGSWYGRYKGVLDDPFFGLDQASNSQSEESMKLSSETKPRPIPKAFVDATRQILYSYPEGINMSDLQKELKRINVTLDKDFFGYKKLSHLLASMPSVLKFIPNASLEGQPLVVGTCRRIAHSRPSMIKPVQDVDVSDGEKDHTSKQNEKPRLVNPTPSNELDTASSICKTPVDQKETISDSGKHTSIHTQEQDTVDRGIFKRIKQTFFGFQHGKAETFSSSKANDMEANHYVSRSEQRKNIDVERGFLQRIWRAWNGPIAGHPAGGLSHEDPSEAKSICKTTEKLKFEDKVAKLNNNFSNEPSTSPSSLEAGKSLGKDKTFGQSEMTSGYPDTKKSFFSRIANWWILWRSEKDQEIISAPQKQVFDDKENDTSSMINNDLNNIIHGSKPLDPLSKGYFWDALESFLLTSKGTDLILKSRTREELVHGLQKEGPWVLKDFTETELFELINLIIVEKQWLEESASKKFPFKLSLANKQKGVLSHMHSSSNGLSSLFRSKILKSNLQSKVQQEISDQNSGLVTSSSCQTSHAKPPQNFWELRSWFQKVYKGFEDVESEALQKLFESKFNTKLVSSIYGHSDIQSLVAACLADKDYKPENKKSSLSRNKILNDCKKLLAELFHEYPDGFNMGLFKSAFLQKYGYALDIQMLGYPKLASLLQIMPGVQIESSFVIPAERFHSSSSWTKQPEFETLVSNSQDDKGDAINKDGEGEGNAEDWEELGPVSVTVINKGSNADQVKDVEAIYDEASLSDEAFSDSDGESPSQLEEQEGKSKRCGENSSLIQILDSWYGRKEADKKEQAQGSAQNEDASSSKEWGEKNEAEAVECLVDCSKSVTEILEDVKPSNKPRGKVTQPKQYSFVSESFIDNEKLVDSILGSLKKAGDSKLHS